MNEELFIGRGRWQIPMKPGQMKIGLVIYIDSGVTQIQSELGVKRQHIYVYGGFVRLRQPYNNTRVIFISLSMIIGKQLQRLLLDAFAVISVLKPHFPPTSSPDADGDATHKLKTPIAIY